MLNNILLCSIAAVVLTGTTYPLFADLLFGARSASARRIFNATVLPLAVPLFAAMAVGPGAVLEARARSARRCCKLWWAALIAAAVGVIAALGLRQRAAGAGFRRRRLADRGRASPRSSSASACSASRSAAA